METKDNPHVNHRERLIDKLLKSPEIISDHELLEILLYPVIPRKDTNATAHRILSFFGNIENVFNATPEALTCIDGVGKRVAAEIVVLGKVYKKIYSEYKYTKKIRFTTFENCKQSIIDYFLDFDKEVFIFIMLDKNQTEISRIVFEENNKTSFTADIPEISKAISVNNPIYAIIAHNHPSGNVTPSVLDDLATAKINMICDFHGVRLLDHIIVSRYDAYSYNFTDGKLDYISDKYNINNLFNSVER